MADWLNHVVIASPRNGTTTQTANPSTGTTAGGTNFSPTAGRFLLCFAFAGVTFTTPAGWTLPANGSAVGNGGLYCWWRSAAGGDTVSSTINATNYPAVFDFYEFPSGSAFVKAATAIGVASGAAGPSVTALTGTNRTAGAVGVDITNGSSGSAGTTWNAGTREADTAIPFATTDGYVYSTTDTSQNAATSQAYTATYTSTAADERLTVAVSVAASAAAKPNPHRLIMPAVHRASLY
jgi:hypothetical protein